MGAALLRRPGLPPEARLGYAPPRSAEAVLPQARLQGAVPLGSPRRTGLAQLAERVPGNLHVLPPFATGTQGRRVRIPRPQRRSRVRLLRLEGGRRRTWPSSARQLTDATSNATASPSRRISPVASLPSTGAATRWLSTSSPRRSTRAGR